MSARMESDTSVGSEALFAVHARLGELARRMQLVSPEAEWLPFYALRGDEEAPSHYFELSRFQRGGSSRIVLKEVRDTAISLVEKSFRPEDELSEKEEALQDFLTKEDCETEEHFLTERSKHETILGFVLEFEKLNGASSLRSCVFALGDEILNALAIDLPEGTVSIGFPTLDAVTFSPDANLSQPPTEKDLELVLKCGGNLLDWAEGVMNREVL
jgi:hypothetical protein